jgi:hypothetical protein
MNRPIQRDRGREHAGRVAQLAARARLNKLAGIQIFHDVTTNSPDGQPWPPPESNALWVIVRRADGHTVWRAIQVAQIRSAAPDF